MLLCPFAKKYYGACYHFFSFWNSMMHIIQKIECGARLPNPSSFSLKCTKTTSRNFFLKGLVCPAKTIWGDSWYLHRISIYSFCDGVYIKTFSFFATMAFFPRKILLPPFQIISHSKNLEGSNHIKVWPNYREKHKDLRYQIGILWKYS